jgi:Ni,Fe-hydrogenase III large subunit
MTPGQEKLILRNGDCAPLRELPTLEFDRFRELALSAMESGARLTAFFAIPGNGDNLSLCAVLADDLDGTLSIAATSVRRSFPSLTPDCPQATMFEREIAEQWGVGPEGHPWFKPVRHHPPYRAGGSVFAGISDRPIGPRVGEFFRVEGREVHEVAVGPVHAGIIEPGHFRFQCHGENVLNLEISLGYQHRGIERAMESGPDNKSLHLAETLAGDTTIGHAIAHCEVLEALGGAGAPARAETIRGIALELERLANHAGDLGALAGDVGYLPTMSYCGRIRGDFLNMTALLCGNRFGRGLVRPGGCAFDLGSSRALLLKEQLDAAAEDIANAVELLWTTPSVLSRFEGTGILSRDVCEDLGIVGPPARACGMERDVRFTHPTGIYQFSQIPVSNWDTGDVFARAYVRWVEIQRSVQFLRDQIPNLPQGTVRSTVPAPGQSMIAVSLVEGWRGEICHVAVTDDAGRFRRYKVIDPSFHNWTALEIAMRNQQISDFPLCNKSFNLSYCGHDL